MNLFLDDVRDCLKGYVLARTVEEAKAYLKDESIKINKLSLDHDMGEDEEGNELLNGYDLVKWFCETGLYCNEIYIHSDNPVGRDNMYHTLKGAQRRGFISDDIKIYYHGDESVKN